MNLVMRGITPGNIVTRCADSLDEDWPKQTSGSDTGKPLYVDAVVSNPPYSLHWDPTDGEYDARFKNYGVAPRSKADYAFLLHELHHLKPDGILTIVLPHGVLFRGDTEKDSEGEGKIRKNLIEKNHIDTIIGLPANIFFGTGIPTLIMVLKQHRDNDDILIIDASKGFVKDGKNNRLRACDIKRIADTIRDRATIPGFSRTVERDEIRRNGYNLNIPRYVDSSEAAEPYDIYATMFGGIPESEINQLQTYWDALPSLRADLFQSEPGHPYAGIKSDDITATIEQNTDACNLKRDFADAFSDFAGVLHHRLITNINSVQESTEQEEITTDIFRRLQQVPLVDKYMAYQSLSDNWETIMSDIETIQTEGIEAVRVVKQAYKIVKSGNEEVEVPDGLKGRILPFGLVQHIKFRAELDAISNKQARVEEIISSLDELRDSLTEEEAEKYLDENDNTKFNKKAITAGAKAKGDDVEPETQAKLKEIVGLWDKQTKLNKEIKADKITLEQLTIEAIENLSDEEVELFLHKKWIDPVCEGINGTLSGVLTTLEKRVVVLKAKYAVSYNEINRNIADAQNELSELIAQLTGDEFAIKGLQEFQNYLKD